MLPYKTSQPHVLSTQRRPLRRPLPSCPTRPFRLQGPTAASQPSFLFFPYFLVAMETHVIYVPCVALETEEHPRRGRETRPCHSKHTRGRRQLMAGGSPERSPLLSSARAPPRALR